MTTIAILGGGRLGRAIEAAWLERGGAPPRVLGRPGDGRCHVEALSGVDLVVDASTGEAVVRNLDDALAAGCRRFVLATSGWDAGRDGVAQRITSSRSVAVVAPNLGLGAAIFLRLAEHAASLLLPLGTFDPYVVEWHRRGKRDRPSGTARELARRLGGEVETASVRAGASPGMHLVGFDSSGETIELHLTARDRSAYGAGALAAIDWLVREPRRPGLHPFDAVVDDLLGRLLAATA
jgi:4-hydroxy-tetrahydrodipicolinate reductase